MTREDLSRHFSRCFEQGELINEAQKGMLETWQRKDITVCREQFPRFENSMLVIWKEKVYAIADKTKLEYHYPDGGKP